MRQAPDELKEAQKLMKELFPGFSTAMEQDYWDTWRWTLYLQHPDGKGICCLSNTKNRPTKFRFIAYQSKYVYRAIDRGISFSNVLSELRCFKNEQRDCTRAMVKAWL